MAASDQPTKTEGKKRLSFLGPVWSGIMIGAGIFMITSAAWQLGYLQSSEFWIYDHFIRWQSNPNATDPRFVLVLTDEKDVESLDYPIRDKMLSALLEKIEGGNPVVVGLDLYRDLPEPRDGSESDSLAKTFQKYPNIIGIFLSDTEDHPYKIPPPRAIALNPDQFGFNDFPNDDDAIVRRAYLFEPNSLQYVSFACMLAEIYLGNQGISMSQDSKDAPFRAGKAVWPRFHGNDGGYVVNTFKGWQILLDFRCPQKFTTLSIRDALKLQNTDIFKDKIVLIGAGADSSNDKETTPLSSPDRVPGTVLHAQVVNQLLRDAIDGDKPILSVAQLDKWLFGAFWCLVGVACGFRTRSHTTFALCVLLGVLAILSIGWAIFANSYWMPVMVPIISFVISAMLVKAYAGHQEERQKMQLMKIFSQHVSKNVAQKLWQQRDSFIEGGRPVALRLTATILFTDLKDFSTISEKMKESELMDWLNEYFTGMADQVEKNHGIINKYIGDAVMAIFGVPERRTTEDEIRQDAINAVRCALDMAREMDALNRRWKTEVGKPQAMMRVGINTGEIMAGGLGSHDRLEYTVIGDSVNTASRLEGFDKDEKLTGPSSACRVLIGGATFKYVEDAFILQHVGSTELKGQKKTTEVYKVIDFKNSANNIRKI